MKTLFSITGNGNQLSMNEIIAQSFIFFLGGYETSAATVTFALFELSQHPDIQKKVRDELLTVLKKHDDKLSYDAINELVYMQQVIDGIIAHIP